jgi:hypothetical protein
LDGDRPREFFGIIDGTEVPTNVARNATTSLRRLASVATRCDRQQARLSASDPAASVDLIALVISDSDVG